jgi:glycosyltransferase involved in cell wall biosynthesis
VGSVVSTPYLYAKEVLADRRGLLVPFGGSEQFATATLRFLDDAQFQLQTRRRAYEYAKAMFWPVVGKRYLECFGRFAHACTMPKKRVEIAPLFPPATSHFAVPLSGGR